MRPGSIFSRHSYVGQLESRMNVTQQSVLPRSGTARPHLGLRSMLRESRATLQRLPDGLEFPIEFRGRISFEPDRCELVFRGLMAAADYCLLDRLSDDAEYHRALGQLYHGGAFQTAGRPAVTPVPVWLWALTAACFGAAGLIWWCWLMGS